MIYIIDYGAGNLKSVFYAFKNFTPNLKIVEQSSQIKNDIRAIILPGDGSFPFAFTELKKRGFANFIQSNINIIPLLGICVGFQLLFESSTEDGGSEGLALLAGNIKKFTASNQAENNSPYKIPHMGWNKIKITHNLSSPLYQDIQKESFCYFVHSYYADEVKPSEQTMTCNYIQPFCCGVIKNKIIGYQFHPEKSAEQGLKLLENFLVFFNLLD